MEDKAIGDVVDDLDRVGISEEASTQSHNGLKLRIKFTSLKDFKTAVKDYTIRIKKQ